MRTSRAWLASLVLLTSALCAAGCRPGYLDVTGQGRWDSGSDGFAADGSTSPGAGWGLQFDGIDDCAQALRPVSKDFTIEAWVVLDGAGNGTYWWEGFPIFWADLYSLAGDFSVIVLNGMLWFATGSPNGDAIIASKSPIPISQWVHVAVTRTMSTGAMAIFVDGKLDGSGIGSTVALTAQPNLWVFCSNANRTTPGTVDELRVWNQARTETEIRATMRNRLAGNEDGLVGYWRFDDGSGTSATDSSPTGNSIMLGGGTAQTVPTWVVSTAPVGVP